MKKFILLWFLFSLSVLPQATNTGYPYPTPLPTTGNTPLTTFRVFSAPGSTFAYQDDFPVVWDVMTGGGYRSAATTTERDAILPGKRKEGMLVYVAANQSIYRLGANLTSWTDLASIYTGGGTNSAENVIYLFSLNGQSNAIGHGTGGSPPTPIAGTYQWTSAGGVETLQTDVADPTEDFGQSLVPQFANTYRTITGRKVAFVKGITVGGAAQAAAADGGFGNFDAAGALRAQVLSRTLAAKTAFESAGYTVIPSGILWLQGEQDAIKIADATITSTTYKNALQAFITYLRVNITPDLPFYIVRTGLRTNVADTGQLAVRQQQEIVDALDDKTKIIYRDTINFPALGFMADTVHYNQLGLNDIGLRGAMSVLGREPLEGSPLNNDVSFHTVTADNTVLQVGTQGWIKLLSDNATAANRSLILTAPLRAGATLTLVNASASFNVQLVDGQAVSYGDGAVFLNGNWESTELNDSITLTSDGSNWIETSRQAPSASGSAVTSIVAGSGITISGPTGAVTVNAGAVSSTTNTSIYSLIGSDFITTSTNAGNTGLTITLEANATYVVRIYARVSSSGTSGLHFGFTTPAGSTYGIFAFGQSSGPTAYTRASYTVDGLTTNTTFLTAASTSFVWFHGTITTDATPDSINLRMASALSGQSVTLSTLGTYMQAERIL